MQQNYGIFSDFFLEGTLYLPLLNIQRNNAKSEKKIDSTLGKRKKQRIQKSVGMYKK